MPPKPWEVTELRAALALDTGSVRSSDLTSHVHELFDRHRWTNVMDEEYNLLLPSLRLASNLLQVGMPWLSTFLPSDPVHQSLTLPEDDDDDMIGRSRVLNIDLKTPTPKDLDEAKVELTSIAGYLDWQINYDMARQNSWLGVTRLVPDEIAPRPWRDLQEGDIEVGDECAKRSGIDRRPLIVGIMGEYLAALKKFPPDSEEHLRARFLSAITITHEIAHVAWAQDFRSAYYDNMGMEPYIGDECWSELGLSFIASIFSGFNPFESNNSVPFTFDNALCWDPLLQISQNAPYRTKYSIPTSYLENILSQAFWDDLGSPTDATFVTRARHKLRPNTGSTAPAPATAMIREWTVNTDGSNLRWSRSFNDRRKNYLPLSSVTVEERSLAAAEILATLNPRGRVDSSPQAPTKQNLENFKISNLKTRRIDDGVVYMDLVPAGRVLDLTALTRVEVRYRSPEADALATKRLSAEDEDDEEEEDFGEKDEADTTWGRTFPPDPEAKYADKDDRFGFEDYDARDVNAFLRDNTVSNLERKPLIFAYNYCMQRGIPFGASLSPSDAAQRKKLNFFEHFDRGLIERIRQYRFREAEKRFSGDLPALVKIKAGILISVFDWAIEDLKKFCAVQGLEVTGNHLELRGRVERWYKVDLNEVKSKLSTEQVTAAAAVEQAENDVRTWDDADFKSFFRTNNLPDWGERRIWIHRVNRFNRERLHGGEADRNFINRDTNGLVRRLDVNGIETYAWDASLSLTSVAALKADLFIIGIFPSDCTLNLYFGSNRQSPLKDEKPLAYYDPADWRNLSVTVTRPNHRADLSEDESQKPVVYTPRLPGIRNGGITGGSFKGTQGNDSKGSQRSSQKGSQRGSTLGSAGGSSGPRNSQGGHLLPPPLKRSYDNFLHDAPPALSELLQEINTQGAALRRITQPGGGRDLLRPHLQQELSTSAREMLDNLEDMEELRRENGRAVGPDAGLEGDGEGSGVGSVSVSANSGNGGSNRASGNGSSVDEANPRIRAPPSHMTDLYRRIKGD